MHSMTSCDVDKEQCRWDGLPEDYFLTIPVGVAGVEVPMTSEMIVVSAGFYRPEDGAYEVSGEHAAYW